MDRQTRLQSAQREHGHAPDRGLKLNWTLETFDRAWLTVPRGQPHPLDQLLAWLAAIQAYECASWDPWTPPGAHAQYDDPASPPAALYLYGEPGRGKSHAAHAIALKASEPHTDRLGIVHERSVRSINDTVLIGRYKSDLNGQYALIDSLVKPWLLILDDMGQWGAEDREQARRAYYGVINARYEAQKWTIVTSNDTPDQLVPKGILNSAALSRLGQMTKARIITFLSAEDYRTHGGQP